MATTVVVEHSFDPPLTEEALGAAFQIVAPCLKARGARWIRSYVSSDGKRMVCEFEAADAEAVRESLREAGVPFDRVWPGKLLT
ncbi:MAG TPA: DUF4242 domain-containing protein [Polyangiaceae bacterium]|jgi:hypothetical protein|nr:DUF4242 domain-containing protein [Polyangiaceae bacterium]